MIDDEDSAGSGRRSAHRAMWARWVMPRALAFCRWLSCGIALGSWWAYYELGWGSYWFWHLIENASLLPWLTGATLLHSAILIEKREALKENFVGIAGHCNFLIKLGRRLHAIRSVIELDWQRHFPRTQLDASNTRFHQASTIS